MMRVCITILVVACSPFSLVAVGADEKNPTTKPAKPSAAAVKFFETKIRPVLVKQCYDCHGPESDNESGLRLDSLAAILQGGRSGPAIIPGKPRKSLLILAVNHDPSLTAMPPKTKLSRREIADLTSWVRRAECETSQPVAEKQNQDNRIHSGRAVFLGVSTPAATGSA